MRQDYRKMQEEILPSRKKQEEIWSMIEKKTEERQNRFSHRYTMKLASGIVAAILVCVLCLPQTGVADSIKSFLNQYFDKSVNVGQDIVKNVYEDSDGHIKMQVTKMLSDGAFVYLDICYEALDNKGKNWLANKEMSRDAIEFLYEGDVIGKIISCSFGLEEYKDMATEQARYFTFIYKDYSGNFNLNGMKRILSYPMCEKKGKGEIEITSNIDTFAYQLKGKDSPSKFYTPQYLLVSKFSYGIFGKNQGVYTRSDNATYLNEDFLSSPDSENIIVSLIMKDGSKMTLDNMAQFGEALNILSGYDLLIGAGHFYDEHSRMLEKHKTVNPEELAGIEINGVYYDLVLDDKFPD